MHYCGFKADLDEWIPLSEAYRICRPGTHFTQQDWEHQGRVKMKSLRLFGEASCLLGQEPPPPPPAPKVNVATKVVKAKDASPKLRPKHDFNSTSSDEDEDSVTASIARAKAAKAAKAAKDARESRGSGGATSSPPVAAQSAPEPAAKPLKEPIAIQKNAKKCVIDPCTDPYTEPYLTNPTLRIPGILCLMAPLW